MLVSLFNGPQLWYFAVTLHLGCQFYQLLNCCLALALLFLHYPGRAGQDWLKLIRYVLDQQTYYDKNNWFIRVNQPLTCTGCTWRTNRPNLEDFIVSAKKPNSMRYLSYTHNKILLVRYPNPVYGPHEGFSYWHGIRTSMCACPLGCFFREIW